MISDTGLINAKLSSFTSTHEEPLYEAKIGIGTTGMFIELSGLTKNETEKLINLINSRNPFKKRYVFVYTGHNNKGTLIDIKQISHIIYERQGRRRYR